MQWSIIFVVLAISFGRSLSQHCEVVESQHECGGYCYGAVKPVLEYLAILQKRVESCEAKQPADTQLKIVRMEQKIETLERQQAVQQEISRTADTQSKIGRMEEKLDVLGKQMATKQELEKISHTAGPLSKFAQIDEKFEEVGSLLAMHQELILICRTADSLSKFVQIDQKLEALRNLSATQQELENTVSKIALVDEKLEALRNQSATKQELENTVSNITLVDEKLEALRNQSATQQELEKISKQSAETLSAVAQMKEKLEDLRNQTAVQQVQSRLLILYHSDYFKKIGSKYYYIEKEVKLNWHDALKKCRDMGAHLVSLQSKDELKAVGGVLVKGLFYWTDLNDLETEGEFISATTGTKGTFFHWAEGQPSNIEHQENCVSLLYSSDGYFKMWDESCEYSYRFICEASFD